MCLREYTGRTKTDIKGRSLAKINWIFPKYKHEVLLEDVAHKRNRATSVKQDQQLVAAVTVNSFQPAREVREELVIEASVLMPKIC